MGGTQLNGLSQAVSYGDDAQQATNYPIFRLSSGSQVVYLRSSNFSTLGVATGSTPVTADIEVPSTVIPGTWQMVAIANGIPSAPVDVQVVAQDCYLIFDRDTFGEGEIQAMINLGGAPAVVSPALYVVVEGYSANDIGLTMANLGNPPHKPNVPSPIGGLTAVFSGPVLPEDSSLPPHALQRFTFPYSLQFSGESVFAGAPQTLTVSASFSAPGQPSVSNQGLIYLIANPDPFILHGDEAAGYQWYLSTDLRVFQLNAGGTRFGATLGTSGSPDDIATTFIQDGHQQPRGRPGGGGIALRRHRPRRDVDRAVTGARRFGRARTTSRWPGSGSRTWRRHTRSACSSGSGRPNRRTPPTTRRPCTLDRQSER